jgi:hypothetical protein
MHPASDSPSGGGSSAMRRWGPIAAIVVVIAIIAGVVLAGGGDDDDDGDTVAGGDTDTTTEVTTADGEVSYPMSFRAAQEAELDDLDWGERCDTERGQVKMPTHFAAECYLPFEGDNGGATDVGVTAESIKIVVYQGPDEDPIINYITDAINVDDTNSQAQDTMTKWVDMLSTYYETYGRTVEIDFYVSSGIAVDEVTARADAVKIAEDMKPFQVWGGPALTDAFADELTSRGIQCFGCGVGETQATRNERAPLSFGLGMTSEQARRHNVEALVKQVAGQNAEYAGDPAFHEQERKFGYLYIETSEESAENARRYRDDLAAEGVELAEMVPYALDPATLQETASNAITKLKSAGVTTVIFAGDPIAPRDFTQEATAQDYFPEWFLNLSVLIDTNVFSRTYDQEQWKHAFGLSALTTRLVPEAPGEITGFHLYEWFHGEEPQADDTIGVIRPAPDFFFTVLQEVGPNLTHESFRDAAFRLDPLHRGVTWRYETFGDHGLWDGLEGDDYGGIDDVTKVWWDPDDEAADEIHNVGRGVWQFVDGGTRYLADEWEAGSFKAFDPDGATGVLSEAPVGETPPDYEPLPVRQ